MNAVTFQSVGKRFGDVEVLKELSVDLPLQGLTFLVGKSGSGKSVLCRLAVGLLRPDEGVVITLGISLASLPERELVKLRAQVPYLVQGSALLDWLTLEDNVALASSTRSRGATHDALHRMGLWSLKDRTPPQVGPGIRKRAALARALVLNPRCLLLDEPTTGLDAKAAEQVEEALLTIRQQGLGAIIVSHDYRALSVLADRVIALHQGAVAYQGSKEGFLEWAKVAKG